ncbi:hypothetical protein F5Y12DRAFT_750290 [Xylaria sp. FL1777]|nr:hypothetical protein F5Y12DRAFT_750290 [Xylaria sp. FL1777]
MQTLWPRAAQAQSFCRCRICLHSANALTRRSATAASKRRVTVADVFTACYTTILGTAALIDARRKNERRRELDAELDRAKASLKQLNTRDRQDAVDGVNGAPYGATLFPRETLAYSKPWRGAESVLPLLEELKSICNITYRPIARQSWVQGQIDWVNIESGVIAEESNRAVSLREPLTDYNLADTTTTVLDLVDELLRLTRRSSSQQVQNDDQTSNHTEERIITELEDLRRGHEFPSYQFPTADQSYSARVRASLNKSIRRIFNQAVTSREMVGRICYNLLAAGVPPTIHTYNTLIIGFNRQRRPDLAQAVINSYLDRTTWPATDQTLICLLSHYRGRGGREGMREVVQKMRGVREDGLHLATFYDGHAPLPQTRRTPKAKRNDSTFDNLIRGWLYHEELGIACMTFVACLRNGASLPAYTLHELLRGCLATAHFSNARKLLAGIAQNFENFKVYLLWLIRNNTVAIVRGLLQSLHQIINICWLPFGEIFGETHKTYAVAATSLEAIICRVDAQLEAREAAPRSNPPEPASRHHELAVSSRGPAEPMKRMPAESNIAYTRIAMLVSIERRFGDLEERMQNLAAAVKAVIIGIKTGYNIDISTISSSDFIGSHVFETRRFATHRALNQIDPSGISLTIEDVASQLFRRIPDQALIRPLEEHDNWKRLSIPTLISFFGSNVVSPTPYEEDEEEFSQSYVELKQQYRAAKQTNNALIFSHLTQHRQLRVMYGHGNYNRVGTKGLASFLNVELKYKLPTVLQTTPQCQYNEFSNSYDAPVSLQRLRRDSPVSPIHIIPSEADNSTPDTEEDIEERHGTVHKWEEHDPLLIS